MKPKSYRVDLFVQTVPSFFKHNKADHAKETKVADCRPIRGNFTSLIRCDVKRCHELAVCFSSSKSRRI